MFRMFETGMEWDEVSRKRLSCNALLYIVEMPPFYQDRLGTNIGKPPKIVPPLFLQAAGMYTITSTAGDAFRARFVVMNFGERVREIER